MQRSHVCLDWYVQGCEYLLTPSGAIRLGQSIMQTMSLVHDYATGSVSGSRLPNRFYGYWCCRSPKHPKFIRPSRIRAFARLHILWLRLLVETRRARTTSLLSQQSGNPAKRDLQTPKQLWDSSSLHHASRQQHPRHVRSTVEALHSWRMG